MATNVKSNLVLVRLSEVSIAEADSDATAQFLVCEEDLSLDGSADVAETPTKNCGTFKVPGTPGHTWGGTGIVAGNLAANEVSSQQLMEWMDAGTTIYMVIKNNADAGAGLTSGEVIYRAVQGYFSSVGETFNTGDGMGKFSWEFTPNGAIDYAP